MSPNHSKIEDLIKFELQKAYYNGLDKKGWSLHEENTAVSSILTEVDRTVRECIPKLQHDSDCRVNNGYIECDCQMADYNQAIADMTTNLNKVLGDKGE